MKFLISTVLIQALSASQIPFPRSNHPRNLTWVQENPGADYPQQPAVVIPPVADLVARPTKLDFSSLPLEMQIQVPIEIWIEILSRVPIQELVALMHVSKMFNLLIRSESQPFCKAVRSDPNAHLMAYIHNQHPALGHHLSDTRIECRLIEGQQVWKKFAFEGIHKGLLTVQLLLLPSKRPSVGFLAKVYQEVFTKMECRPLAKYFVAEQDSDVVVTNCHRFGGLSTGTPLSSTFRFACPNR